jgi:hypothetical protein
VPDRDGDDDDDAIDLLVPQGFATTLPRRDEIDGRLTPHTFEVLKHRAVVVVANGFTYKGVLHGADDDDLYLKGALRWWVLPMGSVGSVRRDPDVDVDDEDDDNDGDDADDDDDVGDGGGA